MTAHAKVSGTWQQIQNVYAKVSGAWQTVQAGHVKVSGSWQQFYVAFSGGTNEYNAGNTNAIDDHVETVPNGATGLEIVYYGPGARGENAQVLDSSWYSGSGGSGGGKVRHIISIAPGDWAQAINFRLGSDPDFTSGRVWHTAGLLSAGNFDIGNGSGGNTENLAGLPGETGGVEGGPATAGGDGRDGVNPGGGGAPGIEFATGSPGGQGTLYFIWSGP